MSADNWKFCPKCVAGFKSQKQKQTEAAKKQYGKIPSEKYDTLIAAANKLTEDDPEQTLREDYAQGMSESGEYSVEYHCHCTECEFKWSYKYSAKAI